MPPSRGLSGVELSELQSRVEHWQHFKTGDFGQKWNSSKLIVREGADAIAPLLTLLNDPTIDAETQWFTIRALGNFPDPDVIAAIAAQIGNNSSHRTSEQAAELTAFAIETLAAMGSLAIEVLSQLLKNPQRRLLAAKALNQVRSSGVIPAMVSVANDDDAMVRYYAIDALGSFHNTTVTPILLNALEDPAAAVRKAAVMALGRRSDLQAQHQLSQRLESLLWDIDLGVSCQTALALGRLGSQDAIEALQRVLLSAHTPMALRIDTIRALEWYCDRARDHSVVGDAFAVLTQALMQFSSDFRSDSSSPLASDLGLDLDSELESRNSEHYPELTPQEKSQILVAIIRVLGELLHSVMAQPATEILIQQLGHQFPATVTPATVPSTVSTPSMVTQASIMSLASLGQPQAFDALLPLLYHPADAVPIHTIAALKRLDPDHSLSRVTTYIQQFPHHQTDILSLW
ncbi:HEAT repeat domain-containing protein [Leptothoe sp. PORK10 BA2]|uniref:HEAT repeat domain-containing protein n=1 Tax=Leptothoe sp. PORK10 BA2 TaxID=3110254 RepID=UPI002B1FC006|nr:HEAT repeat domain-containing protein [Leptothoe sp. PORK10 BA2]MEA5466749.1 HEAT repeat domain-containing protein [Leptothoe sp. PORK10 BA2]